MSWFSSSVSVSGFWQKTCLPACSASMAIFTCQWSGVTMLTTSMSLRSTPAARCHRQADAGAASAGPQPPRHGVGRRRRQRDETQQRDEADGEIEPQRYFGRDLDEVEHLVDDEQQDMCCSIDEGADAEHAAHIDKAVKRPMRASGVTASVTNRNTSAQYPVR